ncbi:MAG: cation:proton antiporter [Flammeovirgaceae bacterium]
MRKNSLLYIGSVSSLIFLIWLVINEGKGLEKGKIFENVVSNTHTESFSWLSEVASHLVNPLAILLLQILTIILVARLFSWLMGKIRQPVVMGEILAGIVLGPSLVGMFFPEFSDFLFPKSSLPNLQFLSQIGLILFMFIIGMELDLGILKKRAQDAIVISHASIVFPYFLGVLLAYFIYQEFAPSNISFMSFALFMGIAMSITAFPVLARIVQERELTKKPIGIVVITCAAADDVTAWCLLAVVVAVVKAGGIFGAIVTIALSVLYVILMIYVIKPLLGRIADRYFTRETVNRPIVAIIFAVLIFSSFLAEAIGIHALFGAFLAGVIIPTNPAFRHVLSEKIEDLSLVLLLPLFFVFTGLRTQIGLLNEPHLWAVCLGIILTAIAGKFLGSSLPAKFLGMNWKDSFIIGALMNTRGLMELVVLNIGYDLGVLSPQVFAMMVLMALSTTFMTGPALDLIEYIFRKKEKHSNSDISHNPKNKILISFGMPKAGSRLLQLSHSLGWGNHEKFEITALHLTPSSEVSIQEAEIYEREGFEPILKTANELNIKLITKYKATSDVRREIALFANNGGFELMLVGSSRPLFSEDNTGGKVKGFFEDADCQIGVLIDKGFQKIEKILFMVHEASDHFIAPLFFTVSQNTDKQLIILDNHRVLEKEESWWGLKNLNVQRIEATFIDLNFFKQYDLLVMSLAAWRDLQTHKSNWLNKLPTTLIIKEKQTNS